MTTKEATKEVKRILREIYGSGVPRGLALTKRAQKIAKHLREPLLWLCLFVPDEELGDLHAQLQAPVLDDDSMIDEAEPLLQERLSLLTALLKQADSPPDLSRLESVREGRFALLLSSNSQIEDTRLRREVTVEAVGRELSDGWVECKDTSASLLGRMSGVVTDLYADSGPSVSTYTGYVCSLSSSESLPPSVYKFDTSTLSPQFSFPLHVGDKVSFVLTDTASKCIVPASLRVEVYLRGTISEKSIMSFLDEAASTLVQSKADPLQCVPACWYSAVNEARIYRKPLFYQKILDIYDIIHTKASQSIDPDFMGMFRESDFVAEILSLLTKDTRRQSTDEASYKQDVTRAIRLIANLAQSSATEMPQVDKYLKHLEELSGYADSESIREVACAVVSVLSIVPPASDFEQEAKVDRSSDVDLLDPFLLLEVRYGKKALIDYRSLFGHIRFREDDEAVVRRNEVMVLGRANIQGSPELAGLPCGEVGILQASPLIKWQFRPPQSNNTVHEEGGSKPLTLRGMISDVLAFASSYKGFILYIPSKLSLKHQRKVKLYQFDQSIPFQQSHVTRDLHIGDIVAFKLKPARHRVVAITEVLQYFPGSLDAFTARTYLSELSGLKSGIIEALSKSSVLFKAILNQPSLYIDSIDIWAQILEVSCLCIDNCELKDTARMLVHVLGDNCFIHSIPHVLDKISLSSEESTGDCKSLQSVTKMRCWALDHAKQTDSVVTCDFVESFKCLLFLLSRHSLNKEMVMLTKSLITFLLGTVSITEYKSWKDIPILLTKAEFDEGISESEMSPSNLPQVQKCGSYASLDQYGETYFKLLRYDCYGELLRSIGRLQSESNEQRRDTYYQLKLVGIGRDSLTCRIIYSFEFKTETPTVSSESDSSEDQCLKEGNLMCLSPGGRFGESQVIWAVISKAECNARTPVEGREHKMLLKKGKMYLDLCFDINVKDDEDIAEELKLSDNIVAVESPAFFRAYKPSLEALQRMNFERLHFRHDLLRPSSEPKSSLDDDLLSEDSLVNCSPLYKMEHMPQEAEVNISMLKAELQDAAHQDHFCLDSSQRDAIHSILSRPLSLIKGPPGTGKTFIGVKALQVLLSVDSISELKKPLIVMAHRNHALDHFLELCSDFCPKSDIVRVGGHHKQDSMYPDLIECTSFLHRIENEVGTLASRELKRQYRDEVLQAVQELRRRSRFTCQLDSCLNSMSEEWFQSLLLNIPPEHREKIPVLTERLSRKVKRSPKKCLSLLMTGMMGASDAEEKKNLKDALTAVWSVWTEGIDVKEGTTFHQFSMGDSADSEDEGEKGGGGEGRFVSRSKIEGETSLMKDIFDIEEDKQVPVDDSDVWALSLKERKQLMFNAAYVEYQRAMESMKLQMKKYNSELEAFKSSRQAALLNILRRAKVVGFTITQAATFQEILSKLESPVVIVEEAAEVLESHLLAALTPHVKHLMLIGDDCQLKPRVCWRVLAGNFDVSMFERLLSNNFPHVILNVQGRMHPELVDLYSYHYGSEIKSAQGLELEKMDCPTSMQMPCFWWTYTPETPHSEGRDPEGTSVYNTQEAEMVAALYRWLLGNGEEAQNITVLSLYRRQCEEIKLTLLDARPEVITVDDFQGHESEIIILSLVRHNYSKTLGITGDRHRMVVATSRQQRALYIVGNAAFFEEASPRCWRPFMEKLCCGTSLPVIQRGHKREVESAQELHRLLTIAGGQPDPWRSATAPVAAAPAALDMMPLHKQQSCPADLGQSSRGTPTHRQLYLKLIKMRGVVKHWKFIGRQLDVEEFAIEILEDNYRGKNDEACYQMFCKWEKTMGREASLQKLEGVFEEMELLDVKKVVNDYAKTFAQK